MTTEINKWPSHSAKEQIHSMYNFKVANMVYYLTLNYFSDCCLFDTQLIGTWRGNRTHENTRMKTLTSCADFTVNLLYVVLKLFLLAEKLSNQSKCTEMNVA